MRCSSMENLFQTLSFGLPNNRVTSYEHRNRVNSQENQESSSISFQHTAKHRDQLRRIVNEITRRQWGSFAYTDMFSCCSPPPPPISCRSPNHQRPFHSIFVCLLRFLFPIARRCITMLSNVKKHIIYCIRITH